MNSYRLLAALGAVLVLAVTFCLLVVATVGVLQLAYASHNPADQSAGDTAGWALTFMSPILLPVFLVLSIVAAGAAYHSALRFRNSEKVQRHRHK